MILGSFFNRIVAVLIGIVCLGAVDSSGTNAGAAKVVLADLQVAKVAEAAQDDEDEDDEEFEDDADFMNNPWRVDERKLFAAKRFQLSNEFAMKIKLMDDICNLDQKQKLKLKIAAKGATEKAVAKYEKDWKQYIQQFGGFQNVNNDAGKKKKKKPGKKKRFVINDVDQIDAQVLQLLDQAMGGMGGVKKQDLTNVSLWKRTVSKVLGEQQQALLDKHIEKAKLAKRAARADTFIADMRIRLALSDEQLDEFSKIVRPAFLEKDLEVSWTYDAMATLYLGSKHDKKEMKALLTDEQQLVLKIALKPAEGYAGMFGDNNNVAVVRRQRNEFDAFTKIFDDLFQAIEDVASFIENTVEGVLSWQS